MGDSGLRTYVGDGVVIDKLIQRVENLEIWKENEMEPWRAEVGLEIQSIKEENETTARKMEQITKQIDTLKQNRFCRLSMEVLCISFSIALIIAIINLRL